MQVSITLDDFLKNNAPMTANERRLVCAAWMAATNATSRPTPATEDGALCVCKLPGFDANDPSKCPTCGKLHRH